MVNKNEYNMISRLIYH